MSVDHDALLTVRETARRLGVHENTVRNWVREGALPDARVPGSRFLRFRASDVDRLTAQRGARTPSLQTERRAMNPEFVTANQLKQWPATRARDAQENFPELMRRLLVETPGITDISIRTGDGVALSGYDGLADSTGTAFLPAGQLAFEFGVGEDPSAKATSDYNNRVSSTPSPKTFVFVTPRRWAGGSAWAEERKSEGHFADVKVLDADDLEGWLRTTPGALYWISEHLGLRPREAVSLDTWWERFSGSTNPRLPAGLFLAGRHMQASQLVERLNKAPTLIVIQSEWADDCLAFVHAALTGQADGDAPVLGTVISVSSVEAWDSILHKPSQAVLIPLFDNVDVGRAIDKGHHVITVIDRSAMPRRPVDIDLPRLGRQEAAEALQAVGVKFDKAYRLAALGRRSMPALRRQLAQNPRIALPDWARAPDALILAPLMLVGAWTSDPEDTEILEAVTNQLQSVIEPLLGRVSASSDPLLRRVGRSWAFASPEEAFLLLSGSLSREILKRSTETAIKVLSEPDPVLDLVPDARATAGIRGVRRRYSSTLRRGLTQGLALLGAMGSEVVLEDGSTLAEVAARTVRRLLDEANADATGRLWHQLAGVLPLLAEAAPDVFLLAVEDDLGRSKPVLLSLFQEESEAIMSLGPSSLHPHLLWALETICWSSEHLVDGIRVLARLASLEPGGKGNRPIASLNSILCGWVRHTSASLDQRLQALDAAYRVADEIGWKLTFDLWPTDHGIVTPPAAPRFRDWRPTETSVPMTEWIAFTHALVDRAIDHAGADADRLARLTEGLTTVSPDDRERIMALIEERSREGMLNSEGRFLLWERLHALVARQECFATAAWALPVEVRTRLSSLATALEPTSDPQRFAYLFDWHPDLPGIEQRDFEAYNVRLSQLRREALHSVLSLHDGIERLAEVVRRAASPGQLGWALAELDEVELPQLVPWFSSSDSALTEAAANWARRRMLLRPEWFVQALRQPGLEGAARQVLVRNAPPNRDTWQALRESPVSEDEETYWTTTPFDLVPLPDASEALEQLISHGRAWTAITVASYAVHQAERDGAEQGAGVSPETVVQVLDAAFEQSPRESELSSMTGYCIGELLDHLGKTDGFETIIARYEYGFFRLLEHHREPTVLNRLLATQPEIFVDLVKRVYRGKSVPRRQLSQTEQDHATQAWWVLHEWKGFPGRREDGHLDSDVMKEWVNAARLALSDADRSDIGDELIGQAFAYSPVGDDGAWPAEALRDLLEMIGSRELENGVVLGRINSRGVTWRGVYDGGQQERDLAKQYREWSQLTRSRWPRTARILRELAESYEREARRQDLEAELDADRD